MEAALRTVYYKLTGKESDPIEFKEVRGHDAGIRAGDVITAINGISINGLNDYLGVIHTPAETFSFDYIRGAETFHQEINND